jgi:hypothetical protein
MALALKICFEIRLAQGKERGRDEKLTHWILTTFGAVFCSQGKNEPLADSRALVNAVMNLRVL